MDQKTFSVKGGERKKKEVERDEKKERLLLDACFPASLPAFGCFADALLLLARVIGPTQEKFEWKKPIYAEEQKKERNEREVRIKARSFDVNVYITRYLYVLEYVRS